MAKRRLVKLAGVINGAFPESQLGSPFAPNKKEFLPAFQSELQHLDFIHPGSSSNMLAESSW